MGGSLTKARFEDIDGSRVFTVQYNPKEFNAVKGATWSEGKEQGAASAALEFQKGTPMTVDMTLFFDTTVDSKDVRKVWVNSLVEFMTPKYAATSDKKGPELKKLRPALVLFTWGSFEFKCVVESVTTAFMMFASNGTPIRAKCQVKLKEWRIEDITGSGSGSFWENKKVKLVKAGAGSTVTSVASESGADWREVAETNHIDDPMEDLGGSDLVVSGRC